MKKYFKKGILYYSMALIFMFASIKSSIRVQNELQQGLHTCVRGGKWHNLLCDKDILILNSMIIFVSLYALYLAIDFKLVFAAIKDKLKK